MKSCVEKSNMYDCSYDSWLNDNVFDDYANDGDDNDDS